MSGRDVRVDMARKQIRYIFDSVPAGPPHTMNISDADFLRLRPAVQIYKKGDNAELALKWHQIWN